MNVSATQKPLLPETMKLQRMLVTLMDRAVKLTAATTRPGSGLIHAVYALDAGEVAGLVLCDLALAAASGAALALLPAALVKDAVRTGVLDESLQANYYEVANILASTLTEVAERHVKLRELIAGKTQKVPADAAEVLARSTRRLDLDVNIAGYGNGYLAIVMG